MLSIESAFQAVIMGDLDEWDLLEVVQGEGYLGFTIDKGSRTIKLHKKATKPVTLRLVK